LIFYLRRIVTATMPHSIVAVMNELVSYLAFQLVQMERMEQQVQMEQQAQQEQQGLMA
jgi:hypothetical protein